MMIEILAKSNDLDMWFFDDEPLGIKDEAFVDDTDTLLTDIVESRGIKKDADGFYNIPFMFSDKPMGENNLHFEISDRPSDFGPDFTTYELFSTPVGIDTNVRYVGLCPTLFKYFEVAPRYLYIKLL